MMVRSIDRHAAVRFGIAMAYSVAVAAVMVRAGEPTELWWWIGFAPFFLWAIAPIIAPFLLRVKSWLLTSGVAAMATYGAYVYETDMFGPGARSTSALIFIFLPLYQWLATAFLIVAALALKRLGIP